MNEKNTQAKDKLFFAFNNYKENINTQIEKSFKIYLKNLIKDNKET